MNITFYWSSIVYGLGSVNNSKRSNLFAYLGITLCLRVPTRSSAVAKTPRDASCLSVVSFVASIVQYLKRSFFIISYFSFGFTSAYNSTRIYARMCLLGSRWWTITFRGPKSPKTPILEAWKGISSQISYAKNSNSYIFRSVYQIDMKFDIAIWIFGIW